MIEIENNTPETDKLLTELRKRVESLEGLRCENLPNLSCCQLPSSTFDTWCEPCKARVLKRLFYHIDSRRNSNETT